MDALTVYFAFAMAHVTKLKSDFKEDGDGGEGIVTTVIIIAAFAAAAIVITAILITKAKAKDTANNVKTQ